MIRAGPSRVRGQAPDAPCRGDGFRVGARAAPGRTSARGAFTLFEVLLVIAILGLVVAMVWPDFRGVIRGARLDESAARMRAMIAMARAEAMNEARRYRLTFFQDGTIRLDRQRDALLAPHEYLRVRDAWMAQEILLEGVWVAALQPLPEGPAPILVEDDDIEFTEIEEDPPSITEIEASAEIYFDPAGVSDSARWDLRDAEGRGIRLTLDGRLGRVTMEQLAAVSPADLPRPDRIDQAEKDANLADPNERIEERIRG